MKRYMRIFLVAVLLVGLLLPGLAVADSAPGDVIVTLGENLSEEQKKSLLSEMGVDETVDIIYVSNAEEHQYLGNYMSKADIGTRALSSSKVTIAKKGTGLTVETNNINRITEGMYANALITAGVEDAEIYVTAPMPVSGTAALTGIIKAYEITSDIVIPEEQKQVANEEIVRTSELSKKFGADEATELMTRIKEEIAKNPVQSEADLRELIQRIAKELGLTLTGEELNGLVSLFMRMKDLNINWDEVQNQITKIRDNLGSILQSEETKTFITKVLDFFKQIIDSIAGWFK